jgi:mono/diheme cytochrome c family protein
MLFIFYREMSKNELTRQTGRLSRVAACAALALWSVVTETAAFAEEEDRPVIVVPRADGRELFQSCVLCHKYDGRGGPSEGGYAADLRVTKLTKEEVVQVITEGRMSKGMPAFKGMLDDSKIETLAKFIKEELKLNP